jgi:DNA-binding response OmpR family regulator/DNA-binding CsgD family transcriptional regulator
MQNKTILIVDDLVENLQVIVSMFEQNRPDLVIYQANSAKMALDLALRILPDIILTDWDMPAMSGIDLILELKKHKTTRGIPVIMATGMMLSPENLREALEAGAVDFLTRPINTVELLARSHSALLLSEQHKNALAEKDRQLAEIALNITKNDAFLNKFKKRMEDLLLTLPDNQIQQREKLASFITDLEGHLIQENWQRFQLSFDAVHSSFIQILAEAHPELSPAEVKLCIFLRLGMNTKDISNLLYLNPESIKVARSRLRQKLGLTHNHNLHNYLSAF